MKKNTSFYFEITLQDLHNKLSTLDIAADLAEGRINGDDIVTVTYNAEENSCNIEYATSPYNTFLADFEISTPDIAELWEISKSL
jgi:hypothetical protein